MNRHTSLPPFLASAVGDLGGEFGLAAFSFPPFAPFLDLALVGLGDWFASTCTQGQLQTCKMQSTIDQTFQPVFHAMTIPKLVVCLRRAGISRRTLSNYDNQNVTTAHMK